MSSDQGDAVAPKKKGKHGGKRNPPGGRPRVGTGNGARLTIATRERIRGARLVQILEQVAEGKKHVEPHQVTAALGLLKFQLPTLASQDITSGGEPLTIERVEFKRRG